MDAAVDVRVELRIEPDALAGSMCAPDRAPTAFVGWLGLIDAVERLRTELTAVVEPESKTPYGRIDERHRARGGVHD